MLDTDEIPTLEALWEGGGPRHYATFQLAGDLFSNSATLMVLYSWMATVACFAPSRIWNGFTPKRSIPNIICLTLYKL